MNRLAAALTLLALVGCSQGDQRSAKVVPAAGGQAQAMVPDAAFGFESAGAAATNAYEARIRQQRAFAGLPDRGELLSYEHGGRQDRLADGAYTWHRVDVSEEHALRAIATGHLRLMTPSGQGLDIRYDHHVEHPSGDLSWVGHIEGQPGAQTILTFGADAVYGSIGQPGKRSLRLTTRNGSGWIVETDPDKLVGIASAGANPRKPDAMAVPKARANFADEPLVQPPVASATAVAAAAATTVDVLVGYTQGFASAQGGSSGVMTRLNYLVTVGNEALANSQINTRIRLVHAMQVSYTDASTNESALEQLTGYDSSAERYTTPNAAFNALRNAREAYRADLVTLVRQFRDPEQDGCGIAWLIGGGRTGVFPGDGQDYFGYSVISDGQDRNEEDGETYFCRDETLVHELGHNMGSQHDRYAAMGGDDVLDVEDYGVYLYSFGYKTSAAAGNFYTIMAYGDSGQTDYRVFSNPRLTRFCGGRPCGTSTTDNTLSLKKVSPIIAKFRDALRTDVRHDLYGDGVSDLLYRVTSPIPGFACTDMTYGRACSSLAIGVSWDVVATGDFNGDGQLDLVWGAESTRALSLWTGDGVTFRLRYAMPSYPARWQVIGAGDVDGDGKSDLLLRYPYSVSNNFSYWIMDGHTRRRVGYASLGASWRVAATGDFNGDGRLDLVWAADSNRKLSMWLGNGTGFAKYSIGSYGLGWYVAGAGDVDGDGRTDLLFRYYKTAPNNFSYWIMNGASRVRVGYQSMGASWRIASSGDYNGDGNLDIVWLADSTRGRYIWHGNGVSFAGSSFSSLPAGYLPIDN